MHHASAAETDLHERRRSGRCTVTIGAEFRLASGNVALWTSSASASGVFVGSAHVAPVGATLHLTLHLPGGPLESTATVVRALPGVGMGCWITIPDEADRHRWLRFLESVPPPREVVLDEVLLDDARDLFDFTWSNEDDTSPV